mmetsp:Transcript_78901/g.226066  ORF Transcript_78901/g.226066 Transcript_78901/m.226066 type:complete len:266 (-) Transcript_78901:1849-2646(-)
MSTMFCSAPWTTNEQAVAMPGPNVSGERQSQPAMMRHNVHPNQCSDGLLLRRASASRVQCPNRVAEALSGSKRRPTATAIASVAPPLVRPTGEVINFEVRLCWPIRARYVFEKGTLVCLSGLLQNRHPGDSPATARPADLGNDRNRPCRLQDGMKVKFDAFLQLVEVVAALRSTLDFVEGKNCTQTVLQEGVDGNVKAEHQGHREGATKFALQRFDKGTPALFIGNLLPGQGNHRLRKSGVHLEHTLDNAVEGCMAGPKALQAQL